ncbi:hypothetical protein scyTo_0019848, partial [Scyliorhinus torazame]|nr:hypothetical protein [Scyliorhinus torazame]
EFTQPLSSKSLHKAGTYTSIKDMEPCEKFANAALTNWLTHIGNHHIADMLRNEDASPFYGQGMYFHFPFFYILHIKQTEKPMTRT